MKRLIAVAAVLAFGSIANAQSKNKPAATPAPKAEAKAPQPAPLRAKAELKTADGKSLGTVTLEQAPHGVLVAGELANLPPGGHAFHVHAVGVCTPPFESAGGHFNHSQKKHGAKAMGGMHAGDLPNLFAEGGKVKFEVVAHDISLTPGAPGNVFDADGSALVVHATVDDYLTDPAGNAGGRIACGVVEPVK